MGVCGHILSRVMTVSPGCGSHQLCVSLCVFKQSENSREVGKQWWPGWGATHCHLYGRAMGMNQFLSRKGPADALN